MTYKREKATIIKSMLFSDSLILTRYKKGGEIPAFFQLSYALLNNIKSFSSFFHSSKSST